MQNVWWWYTSCHVLLIAAVTLWSNLQKPEEIDLLRL